MRDEVTKLQHDLERYRAILKNITDPELEAILLELIDEAEARLARTISTDRE